MQIEIWKDVSGYEGYYQVSNNGQVRSLDIITNRSNYKNNCLKKGKILSPSINESGYKYVVFSVNSIQKHKKIHRLICEAFHPNPENKKCVNHKDGIKLNNFDYNVEWATHAENNQHAYDMGLKKANTINARKESIKKISIPVIQMDMNNKIINEFKSIKEAYEITGCDQATISRVCKGKYKQSGGFKWKHKVREN